MTKKISELPNTTEANSDDLLELAQVDEFSPTGFSSRSIRVGDLPGGTVGLPFRFPFEGETTFSGPDYTEFEIEFDFESLFPTSLFEVSPEDSYYLASASLNVQMSALVKIDSGTSIIPTSVVSSTTYHADGYKSAQIHAPYHQNTTNAYILPGTQTNYAYLPSLYPTDVYAGNNGNSSGSLILQFRVGQSYGGPWRSFSGISFKGYADITSVFYYSPPTES